METWANGVRKSLGAIPTRFYQLQESKRRLRRFMSNENVVLNRKILASFLPNHEAVKAFESIIRAVTETAPASIDELTLLSLQERRGRENDLSAKIEQLELTVAKRQSSGDLEDRVKQLEMQVLQKQNLLIVIEILTHLIFPYS